MSLFGVKAKLDPEKVRKIKAWTVEALEIPEDRTIMVTELACREAGCPPLETVVVVLGHSCGAHQIKIHKLVAEISREDIIGLAGKGHAC